MIDDKRIEEFIRDVQARVHIEGKYEWKKWITEIPYIKFDSDWEVKIIPPSGGAIVRFRVKKGERSVSVYLDCYDMLGIYGEPYWEAWAGGADTHRCAMNETEKLLNIIRAELS